LQLSLFESSLNYVFKNKKLLLEALTHKSHRSQETDHERLEYLGDALLTGCVSHWIYKKFPNKDEGTLSQIRALLVCQKSLCLYANIIGLREMIFAAPNIKDSEALLADTFESVCGAIFCDSDFYVLEKWLLDHFQKKWEDISQNQPVKDWKSQLQEFTQKQWKTLPEYKIISQTGPDHALVFEIECYIPQLNLKARGCGDSKRIAAQEAAQLLLKRIQS